MREKFLKEHKRGLYEELMLDGKMEEHLGEIEQTAQKRMKQIITSLAEKNQITEEMKRESNELGTSNELNTKSSRGNDNNRVDLQLNLFTDSYIPPIKNLPSVEEQINNIQAQAEVENTSAFEFTQKVIDDVLLEGSHFADGKFRIYRLFQESYSTEDNITFLKKEYGEGGGGVRNYENLDEWHNAKGLD